MTRSSTERVILGVTSLGHDASCAVVVGDEIVFAGHAERYSRNKNDGRLNAPLLADALRGERPDEIVWYERPLLKRSRMLAAGQPGALSGPTVRSHLRSLGLGGIPVRFVGHHQAHAAGGFFTSPFETAAILVVDAIGEWETASLWRGTMDDTGRGTLQRLWAQHYPHSLGLLYSAATHCIGLKPNEEEYILMGMAAYGAPLLVEDFDRDLIASREAPLFHLRENVHRGIRWWRGSGRDRFDIAASVQRITEDYMVALARWALEKTGEHNLVLSGGVALNCVANSRIARESGASRIWIMPNPGDAGSSLGAIAARFQQRLRWRGPLLGHDIARPLDVAGAVEALLRGEVIGVANGRAEFGPRALGNRSLLSDPRGPGTKDRVNRIKQREMFRPFAPVVLADHAARHFDMPVADSPYMQFVAPVRRPDLFPAITHHDGTARVQTLQQADNPTFHSLLSAWHDATGCPLLLNTSLNIKGEPLVNDLGDAGRFASLHGVPIF